MEAASVADVERAISGALTPAFLLAGVAGLLNVLSQRRNRIVDRLMQAQASGAHLDHMLNLNRRATLSLLSMQACILASVAVCALVAVAFVAQLYSLRAGPAVTVLMLSAMAELVAGLLCFLAEATLARTDLPMP